MQGIMRAMDSTVIVALAAVLAATLHWCRARAVLPKASMTPSRIVELMRAGGQTPPPSRVAAAGAIALYEIASNKGGEDCIDKGAVPALVAALKAYPGEASVAENACRALLWIARLPAVQEACVAAGAVPALVAALKAYPGEADVAETACDALFCIAHNEVGGEACVEAGAVPALAAALKAHPSLVAVAETACGALRDIAFTPSGKKACKEVAAPAVVAALTAHLSVASVARRACGALQAISWGNFAGQMSCTVSGALPALIAALEAHPGEAAVAERACETLCNITCVSPPAIQFCLSLGAEKVLLQAAQASHPSASPAACWALCNISPAACTDFRIVSSAVSSITSESCMKEDGDPVGTIYCCWSLSNIASKDTGRACCVLAGAVPLLAAAFSAHTRDARQWAHDTLSKLGYKDDGSLSEK